MREALTELMLWVWRLLWLLLLGLPVFPVCLLLTAVAWSAESLGCKRTGLAVHLVIEWLLSLALFFTPKETK